MKNNKPKIGVFKYSCCAGCEFQLIFFQKYILELFETAEIKFFKMLQSGDDDTGPFDVALIDGAITERWQAEHLKKVRSVSKYLLPIGSCAVCGGVPAIKNTTEESRIHKTVYEDTSVIESIETKPVDYYVKVDGYIKGCPMGQRDLTEMVVSLLLDKRPDFLEYCVCVECKLNGTTCVLAAYDEPCMGPVTNAGCGALCPGLNRGCYGCWGPMKDANAKALADQFRKMGLDDEEIHLKFTEFAQPSEEWKAGQI